MQRRYDALQPGQRPADTYAALEKLHDRKYDAGFVGSDTHFVALVVETLGGWPRASEALATLSEIIRRGARRHAPLNQANYRWSCWARLSCTLQRANARMVLRRIEMEEGDEELEEAGVAAMHQWRLNKAHSQPPLACHCDREFLVRLAELTASQRVGM